MSPKFGDIGEMKPNSAMPDGLLMMYIGPDPRFVSHPWGGDYAVVLDLEGLVDHDGGGSYAKGRYGPGDIGPVRVSNVDWYGP